MLVNVTSWLEMKCLVYLDRDVTKAQLSANHELKSRIPSCCCLFPTLAAGKLRRIETTDDLSECY